MERTLGYGDYKPLLDRFLAILHGTLRHNLVSLVLYGSVARGTAGPPADIDLLLGGTTSKKARSPATRAGYRPSAPCSVS